MERYLLVSAFLWCLVEVQPQTSYPYVSFLGETLPNHAYVDLSLVGINQDGSDSVQCHTNVRTCCKTGFGAHRGDWFPPGSNMKLPFPAAGNIVVEDREAQRVDLRQRNASSPTGIFRCTIDVRVEGEEDPVRRSAFVGLYLGDGGNVRISGGVTMTVISDLNGPSPQFSLTCNSTGGPATTVTWTRDDVTFTRGTETVLIDPVTAQYTHTLTVSGRPEGLYTCTVSNSKPSQDSAQFSIEGLAGVPEEFEAEAGQRQVVFTWSPPPAIQHSGSITNYTLSCSPSPSSLPQSPSSQSGSLTATGFSPNTLYSCSLAANNNRGTGPQAITSFTTLEDYKFFQLHLSGIISNCKSFEDTDGPEKLKNITYAVLDVLTEYCANCAIDEEYFACDSESPTYVTYRARLEGTSETDSCSLIPLIEAWARTGPNITAGGLLTVDPECPVSISSLTDPEEGLCESPTTAPDEKILSIQNIAIIAGVGGGILLICVVFLVIGLRLCCKYSCRPKKPSDEKALEGLSGVYIIHDKEKDKFQEAEEEDFEKEKVDVDESTPPPAKLELQEANEGGDTQDTDDKESVNEEGC